VVGISDQPDHGRHRLSGFHLLSLARQASGNQQPTSLDRLAGVGPEALPRPRLRQRAGTCRGHAGQIRVICVFDQGTPARSVPCAESAFGSVLPTRRLANPVTLCDGHGVFLVAASGQIQMAANTTVRTLLRAQHGGAGRY